MMEEKTEFKCSEKKTRGIITPEAESLAGTKSTSSLEYSKELYRFDASLKKTRLCFSFPAMAVSKTRFLCQKLVYLITLYLRPLMSFFSYILRLHNNDSDSLNKENKFVEDKSEKDDFSEVRDFAEEEKEKQEEVSLKFKFPTFEEFCLNQKESGNNKYNSEVVPCEFTSFTDFNDASELETISVNVINDNKTENISVNNEGLLGTNIVHEKGKEVVEFDEEEKLDENSQKVEEDEESLVSSENSSVISCSDSDLASLDHINFVMNRFVESYGDDFLGESDFGGELDEKIDENHNLFDVSDDEQELKKLEEDLLQDKGDSSDNKNDDEFLTRSKDEDNDEDTKDLESLWEHQELIEQLKMELKKVRAIGLPTILEESESPRITDDFKPWKIDEFQREDCIGELHRFYKSYRERMRKFDIINYQKMYAMGFLQPKDPLQSLSKERPSPPTLKSLVSQNLWLFKHKINGSDPMRRLVKELQGDLEAVYVGQMCLSWEFLHWEYKKALDLWDRDPRGSRRYNEVAGEFQQFQVLMQRFIEDEPFQGPRVQNYVKTRCLVRNLLQVPVIREDKLKWRKKDRDEHVITSDMLVEMVEESIRIFWRFVRADKDCTTSTMKKIPEVGTPEDSKLLIEIKKVVQKKERKLKDVLRGENCILRKFRRRSGEEDDTEQVLYFFSQVDMKLVSRVLNMGKISRDQLIWCHNKVNRIRFVNRKIDVEPAFLLFPC